MHASFEIDIYECVPSLLPSSSKIDAFDGVCSLLNFETNFKFNIVNVPVNPESL